MGRAFDTGSQLNRRAWLKITAGAAFVGRAAFYKVSSTTNIERWGLFEMFLPGPVTGNPFLEIRLAAKFRYRNRIVDVDGFYDGAAIYRVRFMPDEIGEWSYVTSSNSPALNGKSGAFVAIPPSQNNHRPVRLRYD